MRHQRSPQQRKPSAGHRRGGVFAYAMTYVALSAMLLGLMGTMLHLVLRSSDIDQRLIGDLARLRDAERALREDSERAEQVELQESRASFADSGTVATWTIDGHVLNQEVLTNGERHRQRTIRFRRGTLLSFVSRSEQLLALQVTSPAAALKISEETSKNPNPVAGRTMEILLSRPSVASSPDSDSSENGPGGQAE